MLASPRRRRAVFVHDSRVLDDEEAESPTKMKQVVDGNDEVGRGDALRRPRRGAPAPAGMLTRCAAMGYALCRSSGMTGGDWQGGGGERAGRPPSARRCPGHALRPRRRHGVARALAGPSARTSRRSLRPAAWASLRWCATGGAGRSATAGAGGAGVRMVVLQPGDDGPADVRGTPSSTRRRFVRGPGPERRGRPGTRGSGWRD